MLYRILLLTLLGNNANLQPAAGWDGNQRLYRLADIVLRWPSAVLTLITMDEIGFPPVSRLVCESNTEHVHVGKLLPGIFMLTFLGDNDRLIEFSAV